MKGAAPGGRPAPKPPFGLVDVLCAPFRLILRILKPRLVDRYVTGELLAPFVFGMVLFLILFVTSFNLFKLAQMFARGAALTDVLEMLGLRSVQALVYCLPMAMLLAGLLAFGRLSGDSEVVAMQASGIPSWRLILFNAVPLGVLVSFAGLAVQEFALPPAGRRLQLVEDRVKKKLATEIVEELTQGRAFILQDMEGGKLARLVAARKFEPAEDKRPATLRNVTYIQYDKGLVAFVVQAVRAEWIGEAEGGNGEQEWRFFRGSTQLMRTLSKGDKWYIPFDETVLTLNKTPTDVKNQRADDTVMDYRQLAGHVAKLKEGNAATREVRELEVELERKISLPFAALVLALIGAPLGIRKQRTTAGVGIGLSLVIIIIYYVGMSFLAVLGQGGTLGPVEAAWGCNVAALLVGLYLTWRTSR